MRHCVPAWVCALFLSGTLVAGAQNCSTLDFPVSVVDRKGDLVRGLQPYDFLVEGRGKPLPVREAEYDTSPRRILVVLDTSSRINSAGWSISSAVVSDLFERGRPTENFAFLTTRGPRIEVRFGESRSVLLDKWHALTATRERKGSSHGALDAVLEGAKWFDPGKLGDAILLVVDDPKQNSAADYEKVAKQLARSNIRLFTFLVGPFVAGEFSTFYVPASPGASTGGLPFNAITSFNKSNLAGATYHTGGYIHVEDTHGALKQYKLTPERLAALRLLGWQMYGAIAETYTLHLAGPVEPPIKVTVAASVKREIPNVFVFYPHEPACLDRNAQRVSNGDR